MKIGILTGGGDTASLNAIIHGAFLKAEQDRHKLVGFEEGWKGVAERKYHRIKRTNPKRAGTSLFSSRTNPTEQEIEALAETIDKTVDGLIAIGGDDTLTVGRRLCGLLQKPICFVTKTIDNDVGKNSPEGLVDYEKIMNYFPSGFATAVFKAGIYATELKSTAKSHKRVMVLETMGRKPGWLALSAFQAEPDFILIPEVGLDFDDFKKKVKERYDEKKYVIIVVAEGIKYTGASKPIAEDESNLDQFDNKKLGGVAEILAKRLKQELGIENCSSNNPSYLYRCGISPKPGKYPMPSYLDMKTGIALGKLAFKTVRDGITLNVAVLQRRGDEMTAELRSLDEVVLTDVHGKILPRTVDLRFYNPETYSITPKGVEYFKPIMGERNGR